MSWKPGWVKEPAVALLPLHVVSMEKRRFLDAKLLLHSWGDVERQHCHLLVLRARMVSGEKIHRENLLQELLQISFYQIRKIYQKKKKTYCSSALIRFLR